MRGLKKIGRFIYEHQHFRFYRFDQELGREDPCIVVYRHWRSIPAELRAITLRWHWLNPMFYRLLRHRAVLLGLFDKGPQPSGYLWVQDWKLFHRRYWRVAANGRMLGFLWTAPEKRGQGVASRLLRHGATLCPANQQALMCISVGNHASQRAAERAGLTQVGEFDFRIYCRCWSRLRPRQTESASSETCSSIS